jgi:hypothetical protein
MVVCRSVFPFLPIIVLKKLTPNQSEAVDAGGDAGGAETVVDIDDGDVGGATVEHAEERGDAAEAGAVADAGGDGNDRRGDEATDDAGQRAFHSSDAN